MENSANNAQHEDLVWMKRALTLAKRAAAMDEVPVGALLVRQGTLLAKAYNLRESLTSPLGHAELIAIHKASQKLKSWRLLDATLYVTLEPCVMCAGAIAQARISRLVFGASDPKGGAVQSLYQILNDPRLNHRLEVIGGVLEAECSLLLKDFFKNKRM